MKKKELVFLIFGLFLFINCPKVHAAECVNYENGDGTIDNPYQITNNRELYSINCHMDSHFILMNNLDLSADTGGNNGAFYNDGNGWISIGNTNNTFSGVFDGNGKKISGLKQKRTFTSSNSNSLNYGGLFRNVSGTVKNLYLENIDINFTERTNVGVKIGGISSYSSGIITNCNVSGNIIYTGSMGNLSGYSPYSVGGISGYVANGNIENNTNEANITVNSTISGDVGGIVGDLYNGVIRNCSNKGNVVGDQNAGGITTRVSDSNKIINCKNYGQIEADYAGGIVSSLTGGIVSLSANYGVIKARTLGGGIVSLSIMTSIVEKSYNVGTVYTYESTSSGTPGAGGIAGTSYATIRDCYNIGTINDLNGENMRTPSIGGIAGVATGTINNTYNVGKIKSTNNNSIIGSLIGTNNSTLTNSYYYDNELVGVGKQNAENYTATGTDESTLLTYQQLTTKENYLGFDFENTWNMNFNKTYPLPQLNDNNIEGKYLNTISLSTEQTPFINEKVQINTILIPSDVESGNILWSVVNGTGEGTITNDGIFKGTKIGTVTIVAISENYPYVVGELELNVLPVPIEKIKITNDLSTVSLNNEYEMNVKTTPSNTTNKNVIWSVVNGTGEGTITDEGIFKGTKIGTVTIVAISDDNNDISDSIDVEIIGVDLNSIKIKTETMFLNTSTSLYMKAISIPSNASVKDVVWSSSDTSIATIDANTGGLSTKNKSGSVVITATSTLNPNIKDSITFIVGYSSLKLGETTSIGNSSYVSYDEVIWEIADTSIIETTGQSGKTCINVGNQKNCKHSITIKGLKNGSSTVWMKTISGDVLATSTVYVYTPISNLASDLNELNLIKNESKKINITITPDNISSGLDTLIYTSSDETVVNVDQSGNVTALKNGNANIIVYSQYNSISVTIPVTVATYSESLNLNTYNLNLNDDTRTHQIAYEILPENAINKNVTFRSNDTSVVTVSNTGLITAVKNGTTTVTVKTEDGRQTKDISVTVTGLRKNIESLNYQSLSNVTYNGSAQAPDIIIKDGEYTLIKNTDYTVSYDKNTNVGIADVNIEGIGNYKGSKIMNFNITKATINVTDNSKDVTVTYDGEPHSIDAQLTYDENTIVKYMNENNEYTLNEVPKYTEVGTYTTKYKVYIDNNYTEYYGQKTLKIEDAITYSIDSYEVDETNKYINKIMVNTNIDTYKSNITLGTGYGVEVDSKEVNGKKVLYTGGETRILKGTNLYTKFTNVVIGDINGDGAINSADLLKIRQHLLRTNILSGAYFLSSDINYDNTINSADLLRVRQHLLGTKPIQ